MTAVWLAGRLVRAGGWTRSLLVVGGCAAGSLVLLVVGGVPRVMGGQLTADQWRLVGVVVLAVALPVTALLAAVTRLSAATRDRRLAALRVLGVSAWATRSVAAAEAALLAGAGVVLGSLAFLVLRPAVTAVFDGASGGRFAGRPVDPGLGGWLAGTLGVVLLALLVALLPGRSVTRAPLAVRRQATAARPAMWRLVPLAMGLGLLAGACSQRGPSGGSPTNFWLFLGGAALAGLGLPLATPVGVRLLADAGVRWPGSTSVMLAARRLQQEPAGQVRLVASLLVGLFVTCGALSVLAAFTTTPQYLRAAHAVGDGPQAVLVTAPPGVTVDAATLRSLPGVRAVGHERTAAVGCTADQIRSLGEGPGGAPLSCSTAFMAGCADLPALRILVDGCVEGRLTWLRTADAAGPDPTGEPPTLVKISAAPGDPASQRVTAELELPPVAAQLTVHHPEDDPNWGLFQDVLLLPPGTPGVAGFLDGDQWSVVLDGGVGARDRFLKAAAVRGLPATSLEDLTPYSDVEAYRALLYAVTAVVLGVGLLALLVTGIDRALERRRHLAALTTIGVPPWVLRRSQLVQAGTPLVIGLPVAAGAGLLAGAAYLSYGGAAWALPWTSVALLTTVGLAGGLMVAAATVAGLGGRVRPADLRRE